MPVEPLPTERSEQQPLIMRHYRRHRKQSRWGSFSMLAPGPTLLWMVYWYLMMNQRGGGSASVGLSRQWWTLYGGCAAITLLGAALAIVGLTDREHKRGRAVIGLAMNLVMLIIISAMFGLRVFAGSAE